MNPWEAELQARLVDCLQGVLGSGVTRRALRDPKNMEPQDIVLNLHLFERLFIAASIVKRLRGYAVPAAWLADSFTAEELRAGLAELQAR